MDEVLEEDEPDCITVELDVLDELRLDLLLVEDDEDQEAPAVELLDVLTLFDEDDDVEDDELDDVLDDDPEEDEEETKSPATPRMATSTSILPDVPWYWSRMVSAVSAMAQLSVGLSSRSVPPGPTRFFPLASTQGNRNASVAESGPT